MRENLYRKTSDDTPSLFQQFLERRSLQLGRALVADDVVICGHAPMVVVSDWRLDTLRTIVSYMGGEIFALKKGPSYYVAEPRRALTDQDLTKHVMKRWKVGCYFMKPGSDVTQAALLDFDNHDGSSTWQDMVEAAKKVIAELKKDLIGPSLLVKSSSGKGLHIWLLFVQPYSAKAVRAYLNQILSACGFKPGTGGVNNKQIEVFPKQDTVPADGVGNPAGLPFAGKSVALDPETFEITEQVNITICAKPFRPGTDQTTGTKSQDDDDTRGEAWLAKLGDGPGRIGFNEPLYHYVAYYVAKFYQVLDVEKLKTFLRRHIDEAPKGPARSAAVIEDYKSDKKLDSYIKPAIRKFITERGVTKDHFVTHMPTHRYIFMPIGELWPGASVDDRIEPIPLLKPDGSPVMSGRGKNKKEKTLPASKWLAKNRPVEQMTWLPGAPQIIRDRLAANGEWIEHPGSTIFNTYRPPPEIVTGGNAPDASKWLAHVHKVYGEQADHIIRWLACKVQRPGVKINHALVLGGEQGIGKDTLLEPVKRAVGPWNVQEVSPKKLLDKFSGHLKSVILRVSEARDLGEVNRYALYEHMKNILVAPPDVIQVNEKNIPEYFIANVCGVIFTTNNKIDGLYLTSDDRRHFVAWSILGRDDFPAGYWNALWGWYEQGGYQAVAVYLQSLDLSSFDPKAEPKHTDAFHAIVSASESPEQREMMSLFDAMENPKAVMIEELADAANTVNLHGLMDWLDDRKNRRAIPHRLLEAGYGLIPNPGNKDKTWKVDRRDVNIYGPVKALPGDRVRWAREYIRTPASERVRWKEIYLQKEQAAADEEKAPEPDEEAEKERYFSGVSNPRWRGKGRPQK